MKPCLPFACCAVFALVAGPLRADTPPTAALSMSWHVSIDAQGQVTQLNALPNKHADRFAQARDAVQERIRNWKFTPGAIDGVPQPTETTLSVDTRLIARGGDEYEIRVDDVRTGAHITTIRPPRYPMSAVQDKLSGLVVLRVDFDADGAVRAAVEEHSETKAPAILVKAAVEAAKSLKLQPERVAGRGVAGTLKMPMCFFVVPTDIRAASVPPCAWHPPGRNGAIAQGEALAINPVVTLASDVTGAL